MFDFDTVSASGKSRGAFVRKLPAYSDPSGKREGNGYHRNESLFSGLRGKATMVLFNGAFSPLRPFSAHHHGRNRMRFNATA